MSKSRTRSEIESRCPGCGRPVKRRLSFCLDCGDFIEPTLVRGEMVEPRVTPPLPRRRAPKIHLSGPASLAFSVVALLLLGILVLTVYDVFASLNHTKSEDVLSKAARYLKLGEDENAINLLDRTLAEETCGEKKKPMEQMLDKCLHERGLSLASRGNYRDAVTCFSRVSANYAAHDEVVKLIAEYSDKALPMVFGAASQGMLNALPDALPKAPEEAKAIKGVLRVDKAVSTVVPPQSALERKEALRSLPAVLPKNGAGQSENERSIARYNELLAKYFMAGTSGAAKEPPSYEEWVSSGKGDF